MNNNKVSGILILLSPWIISFLLFSLYPLIFSFSISFTDYNPLKDTANFIGLTNYTKIFGDTLFWTAFKNTFLFAIVTIPITTIISIFLAILLNENMFLQNFYKSSFFMPVVTSIIVVSTIFIFLYAPFGLFNIILNFFGFEKIDFLNNPDTALLSIMIMNIWAGFGYYTLLILAGLQSIPGEIYESAAIDGATGLRKVFYITLPHLKNMIMFILIINTIRTLQIFSEIFVMTGGGPMNSTKTLVYYLYDYGFSKFKMGYASAAAYILFGFIFILSLIQMKLIKNR